VRITKILTIFACLLFAAVAIAQDVKTDRDHSANFSRYRTFKWIKEPMTSNPLMKQRIMEAVNAQLEAKGFRPSEGEADLGVSANTATREEQTLDSFYSGFGGGWYWRRWGGPVIVDTYEVGTLVVDLFDTATKHVVWWGSASDTISDKPEKNTEKLNKAVEKMFKDFPPKYERKTD
jgi:hypothetical protein